MRAIWFPFFRHLRRHFPPVSGIPSEIIMQEFLQESLPSFLLPSSPFPPFLSSLPSPFSSSLPFLSSLPFSFSRTCSLYAIYRRDDSDQISGSVGMIFPISAVFIDFKDFSAVSVRIISSRSENVGMIFPISAVLKILEDFSAVLVESCQNHLSCKSRTVDTSSFQILDSNWTLLPKNR